MRQLTCHSATTARIRSILGMRALDMQAAGLAIDSVSRGTEFAYNTVSQSLARSPVLIAAISDNLFGPAVPKPSQVPTASLRQVLLRLLCVRLGPTVSTESAAALALVQSSAFRRIWRGSSRVPTRWRASSTPSTPADGWCGTRQPRLTAVQRGLLARMCAPRWMLIGVKVR